MSKRRHKDYVRIVGVDDDRADMLRVLQPEVLPRESTVGGFVHAITVGDVAANASLARADIDHIVIRARDIERADGTDRILVKEGLPVIAAIGRLPHSTSNRSEVVNIRLARNAFDSQHASSAKRSNQPIAHSAE